MEKTPLLERQKSEEIYLSSILKNSKSKITAEKAAGLDSSKYRTKFKKTKKAADALRQIIFQN
jgi:hypothetical protein